MNTEDAEEYTQALGQVLAGGWRQRALAWRLGVPQALGMSLEEWTERRLGGYVKQSIPERREAVQELADEGLTQREIAGVLGVSQPTVSADLRDQNRSEEPPPASDAEVEPVLADLPDQDLSEGGSEPESTDAGFPPPSGPGAVKEEVPADEHRPAPADTTPGSAWRANRGPW